MKTLIKITCLFLSFLLVLNCSKNDDEKNNPEFQFSPEQLNGGWKISFFSDENGERTSEFSGYVFIFNTEEESAFISYNVNYKTSSIEIFQEENLGENIWVLYTDFDNIDNPGNADLNDLVEDWMVTNVNTDATFIEFEELYSDNTPEILHITKLLN